VSNPVSISSPKALNVAYQFQDLRNLFMQTIAYKLCNLIRSRHFCKCLPVLWKKWIRHLFFTKNFLYEKHFCGSDRAPKRICSQSAV